ncbi:MAG: helix-turn-helix domain-containing protein [Pseudomonadota bacterium]|nr:helix-turn-helix domain-containing protein [Pseudomonadota bacterium]
MSELESEPNQMPLNQKLVQAREEKGLTQNEVSEALNLRLSQLQKLEQSDLELQSVTAFERGYLRNYAQFLNVDMSDYESEFPESGMVGSDLKSMSRFQYPAPKPLMKGLFGKFILLCVILAIVAALAQTFL